MQAAARRQAGMTLIEVLITLVVLAVGLLGFAKIQAYAVQNNRISLQRSLATMYADNYVECIRANRVQAIASDYNQAYGGTAVPGTVAGDDLDALNTALAADLPDGQAQITVGGKDVTVSIRWKEGVTQADDYVEWTTQTQIDWDTPPK